MLKRNRFGRIPGRPLHSPEPAVPVSFPLINTLAACIQVFNEDKEYISKAAAESQNTVCTASKVQMLLTGGTFNITSVMIDGANEIIDFFLNFDPKDNGYFQAVKTLLDRALQTSPAHISTDAMVFRSSLGTWAALPQVYSRLKNPSGDGSLASGNYMGIEGQKGDFFVKLIETKKITTAVVACVLYNVIDRNNNRGIFFRSDTLFDAQNTEIVPGDCFLIQATIKRLQISRFTNVAETVFHRIKVLQNMGQKK